MEDIAEYLQRIDKGEQRISDAQDSAEHRLKEIEATDRSWALKYIISRTFWATFLVLGFMAVGAWTQAPLVKETAATMFEILKIIALPLATFVLGQYFGATKK